MKMFEARCGSQLLYSDLLVNWCARRDDENACTMDISFGTDAHTANRS